MSQSDWGSMKNMSRDERREERCEMWWGNWYDIRNNIIIMSCVGGMAWRFHNSNCTIKRTNETNIDSHFWVQSHCCWLLINFLPCSSFLWVTTQQHTYTFCSTQLNSYLWKINNSNNKPALSLGSDAYAFTVVAALAKTPATSSLLFNSENNWQVYINSFKHFNVPFSDYYNTHKSKTNHF